MACMLYARINGTDIRLGRFKNREAAEEFFNLWKNNLKSPHAPYPEPIYVEYGRRKK